MIKSIQLIIILLVFQGYSQEENKNKRDKDSKTIFVNETSVFEMRIEPGLIVIGDSVVQMYPNEKFFIHLDVNGDKLSNLRVVKETECMDNTIVIEFKQIASNKVHLQMMLVVTNPFKRDLYFKSSIFLMKQNKWVTTSVLPVKAEKTSYEVWPDIITSITLGSLMLKN